MDMIFYLYFHTQFWIANMTSKILEQYYLKPQWHQFIAEQILVYYMYSICQFNVQLCFDMFYLTGLATTHFYIYSVILESKNLFSIYLVDLPYWDTIFEPFFLRNAGQIDNHLKNAQEYIQWE